MFNQQSIISRINRNDSVTTDELFNTMFREAMAISQLSDGAFDITVAPLVNAWGFGFKHSIDIEPNVIDSLHQFVGYQKIRMQDGKIVKDDPRTMLDCSAIAKGYACDVVADTLEAYGCTDFCIEIGGELVVKGLNSKGVNWHIAINKPVEDSLCVNSEIQEIVELTNCGMATSGNYRNFYEIDGKKYAHTIDPRTGYPVQHNLLSATIVAPDCMTADAWATACMVAGFEKAQIWIKNRSDLKGYLIYEEDGVIKTWKSDDF